jgi:hypothetical protein
MEMLLFLMVVLGDQPVTSGGTITFLVTFDGYFE